MARGRTKSATVMLTGQHKLDNLIAGERIRVAQEVEGGQTPVHAVQTEMLR